MMDMHDIIAGINHRLAILALEPFDDVIKVMIEAELLVMLQSAKHLRKLMADGVVRADMKRAG
jgi:hypothetical protein